MQRQSGGGGGDGHKAWGMKVEWGAHAKEELVYANRWWCGVQAKKPVVVTAPYGSLDPLLDHAHLPLFPVPSGLLQDAAQLHTDARRNGLDATQYGQSFCCDAFRGDAAAILAAAEK